VGHLQQAGPGGGYSPEAAGRRTTNWAYRGGEKNREQIELLQLIKGEIRVTVY